MSVHLVRRFRLAAAAATEIIFRLGRSIAFCCRFFSNLADRGAGQALLNRRFWGCRPGAPRGCPGEHFRRAGPRWTVVEGRCKVPADRKPSGHMPFELGPSTWSWVWFLRVEAGGNHYGVLRRREVADLGPRSDGFDSTSPWDHRDLPGRRPMRRGGPLIGLAVIVASA